MWRVGIDVGGTFTDLYALDEQRNRSVSSKVLTVRHDRAIGVFNALRAASIAPGEVETLVHGSTTATNALVERNYPPAAMITTEGFRDVIEIGRQRRKDLFDLHQQRPEPLIRRRYRFTVSGRMGSDGGELEPLDDRGAVVLARQLKAMGITSVAVCFINAYANPSHERRVRDILRDEHPNCFVALSSDTVSKFREHGRFTTTTIRAVLLPVMSDYYDRLHSSLVDNGFTGNLLILKSNGGMMGVDLARERPEETVESGPAGGVGYARFLSAKSEFPRIISTDMGGTTFDASIIEDGEGLITHDYELDWEMPIIIPMLDIRSVGAGGGSIAWVDDGGSLRVGPRSAGSEPGPVCYGGGGTEPTVTDANLVLGRLEPTLGGKFELDEDAAQAAIAAVGEQVQLGPLETAQAIIEICCENMAQAIKLVLVDRGRDPRDYAIASFGGAGPMHAAFIARAMNIPKVVVPANAGVASAFGAITMELRHDLEDFYYGDVATADLDRLSTLYDALEARGRDLLARDGVAPEDMRLQRNAQMRYVGQFWEVLTPIPSGSLNRESVARISEAFHQAHETEHGVCSPEFQVEFVSIGLTATGRSRGQQQIVEQRTAAAAQASRRQVYFDGTWFDTSVLDGNALGADEIVNGPAIIEYPHSVTVLPPHSSASVDRLANLIIEARKP